MKVVILGNCQTAGIAAGLRAISALDEIVAIPGVGESLPRIVSRLSAGLKGADALIYAPAVAEVSRAMEEVKSDLSPSLRMLRVPLIHFPAFHPDICYAWHRTSRKLTSTHYNSAIGVWCYSKGMTAREATSFYRGDVYRRLGYADCWTSSVSSLRDAFSQSDLGSDFVEFFLRLKRKGIFMHSMNHPRADVLVELAMLMARRLDIPVSRSPVPGEINDGLNSYIWPVYVELADELGVQGGSYCWKHVSKNLYFDGVEDYLQHAFLAYREQSILPTDIGVAFRDASGIDRVLTEMTRS